MDYICKIATIEDMEIKWDKEIENHPNNDNWKILKTENIDKLKNNQAIVYYGFLDGKIICETTALISKDAYINSNKLIDETTAYLTGFRTNKEYDNKGFFSKLYKFMEDDLISRGYKYLTLGVESSEVRNMIIYFKYGFIDYLKSEEEKYPDGKSILVNFYGKKIDVKQEISFNKLIPELVVRNIDKSIKYYQSIGFTIKYERKENKFAFLELQGSQIMLRENEDNDSWSVGVLEYPYGRGINIQIEVRNIDDMLNKFKKSNLKLFIDLKDNFYRQDNNLLGNREFLVQDPDGYLLRFFENLGVV